MNFHKMLCLLTAVLLAAALTGCSGANAVSRQGPANQVEETLKTRMADAEGSAPQEETTEVSSVNQVQNDNEYTQVDYDLTKMSSDMVYSTVYNMMAEPDSYLGKTVKMEGTFVVGTDQTTQQRFYACMIADAAACCAQGMEFVWGDGSHPDSDYPQEGETLCVTGVFDTYTEGEYLYCRLDNASIEVTENNSVE